MASVTRLAIADQRSDTEKKRSDAEEKFSAAIKAMKDSGVIFLYPRKADLFGLMRGESCTDKKRRHIEEICTKNIPEIVSVIVNNKPNDVRIVAVCEIPKYNSHDVQLMLLEDIRSGLLIDVEFIPTESRLALSSRPDPCDSNKTYEMLGRIVNRLDKAFDALKLAKEMSSRIRS